MQTIQETPDIKFFLEWFCFDILCQIENRFQRGMFVGLLDKNPNIILDNINHDIYLKISQYKNETEDFNFFPSDYMDLCDKVLIEMKAYFLPNNKA